MTKQGKPRIAKKGRDGIRAGKTAGERALAQFMSQLPALPEAALGGKRPPERTCKIDHLVDISEEVLPYARVVHDVVESMQTRGFSPRAIIRHLNESRLWETWPERERFSYNTVWEHGRKCMGWGQAMRQAILEKNLNSRGESIDSFTGEMADMLGAMEVAVQTNLNRLVADQIVPETLNEMISLFRFYLALRKELQGLGQEGRYEAEMGALGQAMFEIVGPKVVRAVSDRAKELLRTRQIALDSSSALEAVEEQLVDSGMDPGS